MVVFMGHTSFAFHEYSCDHRISSRMCKMIERNTVREMFNRQAIGINVEMAIPCTGNGDGRVSRVSKGLGSASALKPT